MTRERANQLGLWPDPTFDGNRTRQFRATRENLAAGHSLEYSRWACSPAHYRDRIELICRQGFRCAECGRHLDPNRFDTHHWSYQSVGYEEASDLAAVHRDPCHRRLHERRRGC